MSIRDLTETETQRLLTAAEVEALPAGTQICITFCGGNGPHRYRLGRDTWGALTIQGLAPSSPVYRLDSASVGRTRAHHRCFVPDDEDC